MIYNDDVHVENLDRELKWLLACLNVRIQGETTFPEAPELTDIGSAYAAFVIDEELQAKERLVLLLALVPHLMPNALEALRVSDKVGDARVAESKVNGALIPTVETALYLLAGNSLAARHEVRQLFSVDHVFYKRSVLDIGPVSPGESPHNGLLSLSITFRDLFAQNREQKPRFSADFPAEQVTTQLEWEDLLLSEYTHAKLQEVRDHLEHFEPMVKKWGMHKHVQPGCRMLFHGESGTGKTLAAKLLGKTLEKEVYRVDISQVTSKYIGETSKRLARLFDTASNKGWVLFFDEGDALFGQRKVASAENNVSQYANQDTAYLLQRMENFEGIIIVASNLHNNLDQAFTRRFEHIIKFEGIDQVLQQKLLRGMLPEHIHLPENFDLTKLPVDYSLSPAALVSAALRACRMTYQKGHLTIDRTDLERCIKDAALRSKGQRSFGMMNQSHLNR